MTRITIETALLEQLVGALERLKIEAVLSDVPPDYIESHFRKWLDKAEAALTVGRAALEGADRVEPMTEVADRYAHRLALELECVLSDRQGYYDKAMQVLGEYREAMNAIHEKHSPTFMGEPLI